MNLLESVKKTKKEIPVEFVVENTKLVHLFGGLYDKNLVFLVTKKKKEIGINFIDNALADSESRKT